VTKRLAESSRFRSQPSGNAGGQRGTLRLSCHDANWIEQARNQWGICSPEILKTLHSNFDILQKLSKNKDEILYSNHFKEMSRLNFSLYNWLGLIISLQHLS